MFFKTCTILMTVIAACHSACNTRVELCDDTISKKFLEESRLEPTPLGFVSKHHLQNIFISLSLHMHREKSAISKTLNIYFEDPEPKKVVKMSVWSRLMYFDDAAWNQSLRKNYSTDFLKMIWET